MPAPAAILSLVSRFAEHIDAYKSGLYNETQLRRDYLDPLFKELGWDIDNTAGYAEAYRDVIHEDQVKVGGAVKAPDYGFRIGGQRKFFLEAKKPSVRIKDDISPAYQLRRYAWSAKLPLSILSDFEEFAIYDTRIKPQPNDPASKARIFYCRFDEYPQQWDHIAGIFSIEAIRKGSFDKYAAAAKGKRGTAEVDSDFLATIEGWRADLARNLALRNPNLTQRELNFAVQRVLDRLIFLRICEDRGIEDYERLKKATESKCIYSQLVKLFQQADDRYNSGLFHFRAEKGRQEDHDALTPHLIIDDALLKPLIRGLYYPESPYEFSVFTADILGQVYEQFLGKVITLSASHKATVEDKPEVKKAGGVYYTPTYIVDYIVRQTVGRLIDQIEEHEVRLGAKRTEKAQEKKQQSGLGAGIDVTDEKMPKRVIDRVAVLRILDPSCGSGSFVIGAYQHLLDWHLSWYVRTGVERWATAKNPPIVQRARGDWVLSLTERKRILLNNIYGVDIDSQAVEVTKLSLLLKVLEVEGVQAQQTLGIHDRVLPDLGDNIKCGNSLIGSDFYAQKDLPEMDSEAHFRINVFDWNGKDGYPEIMKDGGFDAVIGNPPYIFTRELITGPEREYYAAHYKLSWEKHNTFMLFMEGMMRLLRKKGSGSFIVPNSWLTIESAQLVRQALIPHLLSVVDLNYPVFVRVSMEPCIFVLSGEREKGPAMTLRIGSKKEFLDGAPSPANRSDWVNQGGRISVVTSSGATDVFKRICGECSTVGEMFEVRTGLQAYERGKGTPIQTAKDVADHVFDCWEKVDATAIRYLEGRDVGRYQLGWSKMWMKYGPWLSQPREIGLFTKPRVLIREITAPLPYCLNAVFTKEQFLNNKSVLNVLSHSDDENSLAVLASVLNSKFISLFYKNFAVKGARKIFPKIVIKNLREFPFPKKIPSIQAGHLISLGEKMLSLYGQRATAKTPHEQRFLNRQISATDDSIDRVVYELYGLTIDEIKLVEASA